MSAGTYLGDVCLLALIVVPWLLTGAITVPRLLPTEGRAAAALAAAIIALSGLTLEAEIVGAFNGFRRWPLAIASVVLATATTAVVRRRSHRGAGVSAARRSVRAEGATPSSRRGAHSRFAVPSAGPAAALAAATIATAQWLAGTIASYRSGITQIESLHYHLPHAAFIVQTGTTWRPHEVSASSDAAFHPLNLELLHAIAMVAFRNDFGSLFINLLLLWFALLAAWVAGQRVGGSGGAGAVAVAGVALLSVALPMGGSAGGTGLNDIGVIGLVLAAVAFLDRDSARSSVALTGLALGLALGSKLSTPGVVFGLIILAAWLWRDVDWRSRLGVLVSTTAVTGAFWYLRDWWFFGSPLPTVSLPGAPAVPTPVLTGTEFTVAHYLVHPNVIRHWYIPSLHADFGVLWPVTVLLPVVGIVLALRRGRSRVDHALAVVAVIGLVVYLVTPTGAEGGPNQPVLFGSNVRYAMPALAIAVVLLAREPLLARLRVAAVPVVPWILVGLEVVAVSANRFWPAHIIGRALGLALGIAVVALVVAAVARGPRRLVAAVAVLAIVAGGAGLTLERHYLRNRYASSATANTAFFAWTRNLTRARIGMVGFPQSYPLYGVNFTNQVPYLGQPGPHHAFNDVSTCPVWVATVNRAHVGYVAVVLGNAPQAYLKFAAWTTATGGHPVFANGYARVFALSGPLAADRCASPAS